MLGAKGELLVDGIRVGRNIDTTGNIYYVDSGTGDDGSDGLSVEDAVATIDAAIGLCTANNGDVIAVMPGHSETLTSAITADIAGVAIVGLGTGNDRPQLTVNGAIDGITVTANNVTISGIYFNEATSASATSNINVAASNCHLKRIHMDLGANDTDAVTVTASGELLTVEECTATVTADGPDSWIKFEGVVDRPIIKNNIVIGTDGTDAFDDGVFDFNSQAVTNALVEFNTFMGTGAVITVAANTGSLVGNVFQKNIYAGGAANADNVDDALGIRVVKSGGDVTADDDLFSVSGRVLITEMVGVVTTLVAGGTAPELLVNVKDGSNTPINASTVITDDAVDTIYRITGDPSTTFNGGVAPAVGFAGNEGKAGGFVIDNVTIESTVGGTAAATAGAVEWTLYYKPLEEGANVSAA